MGKVAYSVTVDDAHLAVTQAIAGEIRARGVEVDRVIAAAGAIRAIGDARAAEAIRRIEGVLAVTPEPRCDLPPIDEDIPV